MFGTISHELAVGVHASEASKVYGTNQFGLGGPKLLPDLLKSVEVVEGDGGVGTVLKVSFQPGKAPFPYYKEKVTVLDNEKRVKETEVVEGGFLQKGFPLYRLRLENIEAGENAPSSTCWRPSKLQI